MVSGLLLMSSTALIYKPAAYKNDTDKKAVIMTSTREFTSFF
jgi:hypothetical protein